MTSILRLVIFRIAQYAVAVLAVLAVVFIMLHASGDPTLMMTRIGSSEEERQAVRDAYGLNKPLPVQFGIFLVHALQGDFGTSIRQARPAMEIVLQRVPATLQLAFPSVAFGALAGLLLGIIAALKRGTIIDQGVMLLAVIGQSVPPFWLGLMFIWYLAVRVHLFPPSGYGDVSYLVLPALTMSLWVIALVSRLIRSSMLEVLHEQYVRTAYAKGASLVRVVIRHALPNAIMPSLTMIGLSFAYYVGGDIVVEYVFSWPGIGNLMLDSVHFRDYPVVLAIVFVVAVTFIILNMVVDAMQAIIDPRVREQGSPST